MTAAVPLPPPAPAPSDPQSIRQQLPPVLVATFDAEWALVLDQAKASKELAGLYNLLNKWRHIAHMEQRDPGSYSRLLDKAEEILRTGRNENAGSIDELRASIAARIGK
ncbi:hypothetical protein JOF56_009732 [Kibdelosporangium banguiense]|uniref:Uncharacterized protein n=1 Tax=Kibdelosporangium banguiense TaxID=1365924 RepID=A0ABS4TY97_9PSEU|nr:DUF6247 family protein [Kibdelosporangium banguiense]MBP2329347.1 hypothetical protein [Kibdelosporangium banguiense]